MENTYNNPYNGASGRLYPNLNNNQYNQNNGYTASAPEYDEEYDIPQQQPNYSNNLYNNNQNFECLKDLTDKASDIFSRYLPNYADYSNLSGNGENRSVRYQQSNSSGFWNGALLGSLLGGRSSTVNNNTIINNNNGPSSSSRRNNDDDASAVVFVIVSLVAAVFTGYLAKGFSNAKRELAQFEATKKIYEDSGKKHLQISKLNNKVISILNRNYNRACWSLALAINVLAPAVIAAVGMWVTAPAVVTVASIWLLGTGVVGGIYGGMRLYDWLNKDGNHQDAKECQKIYDKIDFNQLRQHYSVK